MQRATARAPIFQSVYLLCARYEKFARSNEQSEFAAREKVLTGVESKTLSAILEIGSILETRDLCNQLTCSFYEKGAILLAKHFSD